MSEPRDRKTLLGFVAIFCATFLAYLPALRGELIWNDIDYVTKPGLRSLGGLWRIWTEVGATEQYYPLLHSFFWLQHRLWGDAPVGYHLVNVLLHATAACLLALVVRRLPSTAAWLAALLFALHPVMVESVAWISEQKNTLSTVFYLWAALSYLRFEGERTKASAASATRSETRRAFRSYSAATALFLAALLSKSVTASLPAAILVVLWWKRGRLEKRDVVPLVPWFVAGAAVGLFTAWVEHRYIGARGVDFDLSLLGRGVLAGRIIWFYLAKLFWPSPLIFIYPRWQVSVSDPVQWIYPIGAVALLVGLWLLRHRTRGPLAAYLFFIGSLFPTLGFFNVYAFKFSFVADHWQYLPAIGVFVLAATAISRLPRPAVLVSALVIVLLGVLSWRQTYGFKDMETFYRTIDALNPNSWIAQYNLGELYLNQGRYAEAVAPIETAIRARPDQPDSYENLGVALLHLQRPKEAIPRFEQVFKLRAPDAALHINTGAALAADGQFEAAAEHFREAVRLDPKNPDAYMLLARALQAAGHPQEAATYREIELNLRRNASTTEK